MSGQFSLTVNFLDNTYGPINVDSTSTFIELKILLVELLSRQGLVLKNDEVFYSLNLEYVSLLHGHIQSIVPHEQSRIALVVNRWQQYGPCRIQFHLVDFRRKGQRQTTTKLPQIVNTSLNWVPKSGGSEALAQLGFLNWPLNAFSHEFMFWQLSNLATMQGKLARKIEIGRKQESWRDDWFVLVHDRLWYVPMNFAQSDRSETRELVCPFFVDLGNSQRVGIKIMDSTTFCLTTTLRHSTDDVLQLDENSTIQEIFRAPTSVEAKNWIQSIQNFQADGISGCDEDNLLLGALDAQIADYELRQSQQFFYKIPTPEIDNDDVALGLLLNQCTIRHVFHGFLGENGNISALRLWCYLEDFRRGHPESMEPYVIQNNSPRILASGKSPSIKIWCTQVHKFCEQYYPDFCYSDMDGPNSFVVVQKHIWSDLCKIAREFLVTDKFRDAVRQLASCYSKKFVDTTGLQRPEGKGFVEAKPVFSLSNLMGFRPKSSPSLINTTPSNNSPHQILFATWRGSSSLEDFPSLWWDAIFVGNEPRNRMVSLPNIVLPNLQSKDENGSSALDGFWGTTMKSLGRVLLVSYMKCFFRSSTTSKPQSLSLFRSGIEKSDELDSSTRHHSPALEKKPNSEQIVAEIRRIQQRSSVRFDEVALRQTNAIQAPTTVLPKRADEMVIRKLHWFEESYLSLTLPGGQRQVAVLSVVEDTVILSLFDPQSLSLSLQIRLNDVTHIGPADKFVNSIEVTEKSLNGFVLEMTLEAAHDSDARVQLSRWLHQARILLIGNPPVYVVVKRGYLQKRGRLNTAFRWRWFELSSDLNLRYFKDDSSRTYKGHIDLKNLDVSALGQGVNIFEKELQLDMLQGSRKWVLRDDSGGEVEEWKTVIKRLVALRENLRKESDDFNLSTNNDDDDDDDEE